jgi:predicted nucleic acid-binding Zn ribbon protein
LIGAISPRSTSFKNPLEYLEFGRDRMQRGRAAWMEFHNLATRNPQLAACFMAATAAGSVSGTKKPVYHFCVSFDIDDPVDEATMRRVAERTRRDMGLLEYECVVVAHQDRSHPHLHFVVNLVHPERGTLWRDWRDYFRLERSLRAQEVELGLRIVPGWNAPVPSLARGRDGLEAHPQNARWIKPRPGPRRGDEAFLRDMIVRAAPVLQWARSWAEIERGLAEEGLTLRSKGGGFIITDGKHRVKASQVGRACSRYHLEKRLGRWPDYRARVAAASMGRPGPAVQPEPAVRQLETSAPAVDALASTPHQDAFTPVAPPVHEHNLQARARGGRRPQFGDAGHGIADLFGHTPAKREVQGASVLDHGSIEPAPQITAPAELPFSPAVSAQPPVRQQEQTAPSSSPPSTAPAEASTPELYVRSARRPQLGGAGHGIAELFGYAQLPERERPGMAEGRVTAPPPKLDQPPVPSLAMPAGAGLSGDVPAENMPEPPREPAPNLTVQAPQALPIEHLVAVPVEPSTPARAKRRQVEFLRQVKERATTVLKCSDSWAELERGLAEVGLSLRVKGGGFTVTDGDLEVKASDVGRAFSRFHLQERLGRYPDSAASTAAPGILPAPTPAVQLDALSPQPELLPLPASASKEAELPSEPRFSLFEDEGIFGVYDSAVLQVYFAETRERALTEVERANAIVALYPRVISMGHLREMDGAWRDARGLPRLPEPEGERMVVPAPEGLGTNLPAPTPVAHVHPEAPPAAAPEVAQAFERQAPTHSPEQASSVLAQVPKEPVQPSLAQPVEPPAPVWSPARLVEPVVPIRKRVRPLTDRERYRDVLRAFKAELAALYRDPRAARRAFAASLDEISPEAAARTLESNPGRYGRLRLGADVRRAAEVARWAELYAQAQVEGTRAYARYAARLFRRAEAIEEADRVLSEAKKEDYLVSGGPSRMADRARKADGAERNVEKWLREIYEFPTRARNQIETYRSAHGREEMERALRESPERFGELRSDKRRLLVLRDTTEARWKAGSYAGWLGGAFNAHRGPADAH